MAVIALRHLLVAVSLLCIATVGTAQEPPRTCLDTGLLCINDCVGQTTGIHQWCGDCNYFVQCNGEIMYIQPCANGTYYDDAVEACGSHSNTCEECVVYVNEGTSPLPATPPVDSLCTSTGPDCIHHCDQVTNGIYQWCGRCDYYLQCSGSASYYMACQPNLLYDHTKQACDYTSTTCTDKPCFEELATTPVPNYCTSSPCLFGGTCVQDSGDYHCICAPGYTGKNCSIVINYCESNECQNGGTCLPIIGGYVCQCPPGYTGPLCQYIINNCESLPCLNGGTCYNDIGGYRCECPPQWTGERCEFLLDPCGSRPCINGGTCVNNCGFPQCQCPPQWTGTFCDTYIDHCASSPCQNGATCQNGINGWTCVCPPSFTGLLCDQSVDLCDSDPCVNGGTCAHDCGIYQCFCPEGWTGQNCESLVSSCDPNPCINGGTCSDLGGIYFSCFCPPDYTGVLCESPNYNQNFTCGDLIWSEYPASNGFTRLCYFWADPADTDGRNLQCRFTINNIPLYDDYTGLMRAGGNFGCLVSQNYPSDLPATSAIACANDYQHDVTLGNYNVSARLMVCLRYPYTGIPVAGLPLPR